MSTTDEPALERAQHVMSRSVGSEMVLLDVSREQYFGLDAVGAAMWESICRTGSMSGAHEELIKRYDVDPARLRADLENLVERLVEAELLVIREG